MTFNKICVFIFLIFSLVATHLAQTDNTSPFGWDLSYEQLIENKQVTEVERLKEWSSRTRYLPAHRIINELKNEFNESNNEPIISALMVEHPNFRNNERTSLLFVKTTKNAYFWEVSGFNPSLHKKISFSVKIYDRMFKKINNWKQSVPLSPEENRVRWKGYYAVLSTYKKDKARQMLLTFEDFFVFTDPDKETVQPGRLAQAIDGVTEKIPAFSASLFGSCKSRPSKKSLIHMLGDPVKCYDENTTCFNKLKGKIDCPRESEKTLCFDGRQRYSVELNNFDFVESISMRSIMPDAEIAAAIWIPAYSWVQYWTAKYKKKKVDVVLSSDEYINPYQDEYTRIYRDDCVEVRTVIPANQMTSLILGNTKITWKN